MSPTSPIKEPYTATKKRPAKTFATLSIGKLTALKTLMLTSNALIRMPLNLRLLTNLVEFDATENPDMDLPPVAVVEQVLLTVTNRY